MTSTHVFWFWIALGAVVAAMVTGFARKRRLAPLLNRPCAGREWRQYFPDVPKADIRKFLMIFVSAFGLPRKRYLAFRPDDHIMDIYRAIYPPKWSGGDCMEFESLDMDLKRAYGKSLLSIWRDDLTLGEAFGQMKSA